MPGEGFQVNREHIVDFETDLSYKAADAWNRTLANLWWPRIMLVEQMTSREKIIEWGIETATIHHFGPRGADIVYDPLGDASQRITYDHFGNALKIDRSDFLDGRIDRASKWAAETAAASLYWPQRMAAAMLKGGKSDTPIANGKKMVGFDGLPYFGEHPIGGTNRSYFNLHKGVPLTAENLALITAYMEGIQHGGTAPAGLMPTIPIIPTNYRLRVTTILTADMVTDIANGGATAVSNVFSTAYEYQPPIIAAELNNEPDVWYLAVPADQDAFDGALMYVEREEFTINSYSPESDYDLWKKKQYEWQNYGRNWGAYGLPYRLHRCESQGSLSTHLASLAGQL